MASIADHAHSTKPTLYAHFGNKQQLYRACLEREGNKLTQWLLATYERAADLPVKQQVRTDMRAFFDYAVAHPNGFRLLFDEYSSGHSAEVRENLQQTITRRIAQRIRTVLRERGIPAPADSAELLAAMVVGIAIYGARHALLIHPIDPAKAGELASSLAYAGMRHLDSQLMNELDKTAHG